ncbi:hypothetical protein [Mycobacterium malmoense]|nr:hypothetical protein [Mycobacterium malmoense]
MPWELVARGITLTLAAVIAAGGLGYMAAEWIAARRDQGPGEYDPYDDW